MIKPYFEKTKSMGKAEELRKISERLDLNMTIGDCAAMVACLIVGSWVFWFFLSMYKASPCTP